MAYVPVKVYRANEIRRFLLESGENNRFAFQSLVNQIRQVYPNLEANRVRVMWKDSDGEMVIMSSDLELMDAIRSLPANDQMLRLQLVDVDAEPDVMIIEKEQDQQQANESNSEGQEKTDAQEPMDPTLHRGVYCDGCQGSIHGIRHKCLVCPDYDLCSECVQKSVHDDHAMIRIASPNDKTWKPAFMAAQAPFPFPHGRCHRRHGRFPFPPPPPNGQFQFPPESGPVPQTGPAPPPPTGPAPPPMGPPPGFFYGFPFGHGGCGHRRGGKHWHGWGRMHQANPQDEKMETEQAKETSQQEPKESSPFDPQRFAQDLSETITSVMSAFGIPVSAPHAENGASAPTPKPQEPSVPSATPAGENSTAASAPMTSHPDPKIAAALNYMLAMGYTNEGGWLTKLLEEKRGDISAVLDVLHPRSGQ